MDPAGRPGDGSWTRVRLRHAARMRRFAAAVVDPAPRTARSRSRWPVGRHPPSGRSGRRLALPPPVPASPPPVASPATNTAKTEGDLAAPDTTPTVDEQSQGVYAAAHHAAT